LEKKRKEEKEARSYDSAWASVESSSKNQQEEDDIWDENAPMEMDEERMKEFEDFI
jgi:hypothetical protein